MLLNEAKLGEWVKLPINENNNFSYDRDGELLKKGRYIKAQVIEFNGFGPTIGWNQHENQIKPDSLLIRDTKVKQYPSLTHWIPLGGSVQVEPLIIPAAAEEPKEIIAPPNVIFLFACIGLGNILAGMQKSKSSLANDKEENCNVAAE